MSEHGGAGVGPFVGRSAELSILHGRVGDALAGRGQVVALVGAAGVGKSRLLREFAHSADARPFRLLETGSTHAGIGPYRSVAELLRRLFQIRSDDDMLRIRERVLTTLSASEGGTASLIHPFLSLLEVPSVDSAWDNLAPAARRERTLEAFKRLILSESRVQPVLLLFEDLHWVDTESEALLNLAVQSLPAARVLVLVSYRPQYRHEWGNLSYYTQLRIDPLPAGEATELLDHVLGDDASLGPLKRRLVDWTEGNPFFLEESVRGLEETGSLNGSPGAYKLIRPVGTIEVPATVEDVLAARFDRLAPGDRKVLEAAAAIGRDVPFTLLAAITESRDEELRETLRRLQDAEVLYERSVSPELEFTFKHVLTQEVAYRTQLPEARRHLHARILHALEAGARDPATEQLDRLAHHAFHGELWDRAVEYLRRAGRRALFASANGEAVEIFEQALLALRHLP
jgi:predicted ATPase